MNKADRNFLIGTTVISTGLYLYLLDRQKKGKGVRVLGLDENNGLRFVLGVAVISAAVLGYNTFIKKQVA